MSSTAFAEIAKIEKETEQCMKCGFCTYVCPVYQEEKIESGVARGKNELVKGLLSGELELNRDLADRLYKCTACMACTESCPAKAPIPRIVVAARADIARTMGVRFPYGFVYRNLLTEPEAPRKFPAVRQIFPVGLHAESGRHHPASAELHVRAQQRKTDPVHRAEVSEQPGWRSNQAAARVKTVMRVGYFPGCMNEFVLPHLGIKTVDFLARHGVEVVMPAKQGCCGAAAFLGGGDFETGRKIADFNAAAFSDVDCIVTDAPRAPARLKSILISWRIPRSGKLPTRHFPER